MTPKYTEWRQRQAEAVRLYTELGWDVETIAWFIGVAPNTAWRYLREAGARHVATARRVTVVSRLPRAPYWELHARGGASEVVLGRKFCSGCGRWRHWCDFPW